MLQFWTGDWDGWKGDGGGEGDGMGDGDGVWLGTGGVQNIRHFLSSNLPKKSASFCDFP